MALTAFTWVALHNSMEALALNTLCAYFAQCTLSYCGTLSQIRDYFALGVTVFLLYEPTSVVLEENISLTVEYKDCHFLTTVSRYQIRMLYDIRMFGFQTCCWGCLFEFHKNHNTFIIFWLETRIKFPTISEMAPMTHFSFCTMYSHGIIVEESIRVSIPVR